jgi:hypothetical protein
MVASGSKNSRLPSANLLSRDFALEPAVTRVTRVVCGRRPCLRIRNPSSAGENEIVALAAGFG